MRCPRCDAWNPAEAAWCGQCFARFSAADAAPPGATEALGESAPGESALGVGTADDAVSGAGPARDARAGDVRTVDGEVEWRCATCEGWNPLLAGTCRVCGAARSGFGEVPTAVGRDVDPAVLLATSVVWPGVGHLLAGRAGTGIARALLWGLWLAGGVGLWRAQATLPALTLLGGAALLWLATIVDASGGPAPAADERLRPRALGVLVGAVTGALLLTLVLSAV